MTVVNHIKTVYLQNLQDPDNIQLKVYFEALASQEEWIKTSSL